MGWKPRWEPKGKPLDVDERAPLDVDERAPLDDITDEDVEEAREHWEHMTPEQKEEVRRLLRETQMSIYGRVIDDDPTHIPTDPDR
ncbi:MAG TPA: hypothetical protein VFD49_19855 [Candidatus Dormibacteraeota bacterium]|nr:hypothetical protein [Candidatus Dormibacteraeota bacterium]